MTAEKLRALLHDRQAEYIELAEECGSVAELILKIEVRGEKWTKWDWVLFLNQICFYASAGKSRYGSSFCDCGLPEECALVSDIFSTIDSGTALDGVFTNKTVVLNLIDWIGFATEVDERYGTRWTFNLLAHVFRKFPDMWNMNWMFIRHKGRNAGRRTHRLSWAISDRLSRPESYFRTNAYLDDFVRMYWRKTN